MSISRITGLPIDEREHIRQSMEDILTTPIGSRVMRRDYGSNVPNLIDQPANGTTAIRLYAAIAVALIRWEPRIRIRRLQFSSVTQQGSAAVEIEGTLVDSEEALNLRVPIAIGAVA